ncbi:hypothetical protein M422DRAFT_204698 [Sphaerobolus stellatus SS14]|nr:hypothetical protein M422DRAFT_204698 [Sphaerobolus stellatus SS14]
MTGVESRFHDMLPTQFLLFDTMPTVVLDGGMGTTLEDVFNKDVSHPLWSARFIENEEDIIIAAHLAFLRAGSKIILTSTYQISYETARKAGFSDLEAEKLMQKSVMLAHRARQDYESNTSESNSTKIALSLGPFGATLDTAAEFTGIYPPPYGPSLTGTSYHGPFLPSEEESYVEALAAFHFSRLIAYAKDEETWGNIDIIAFETVPLVIEARAIRIAVARLDSWLREYAPERDDARCKMKPWYISFVFPGADGEFIENCSKRNHFGVALRDADRVYTSFEVAEEALAIEKHSTRMAVPNGLGINCTYIPSLPSIVKGYANTVRRLYPESSNRPWLIIYPNGGIEYDPVVKKWIEPPADHKVQDGRWAQSLHAMLKEGEMEDAIKAFGGLVIGGCCKTSPQDIEALETKLTSSCI